MSPAIELGCVAIIALYLGVRLRNDPDPRGFLGRMALLMAASWIGEDTCIHLYGFYHYAPGWHLVVDQVPLLIVTIWPIVIHSAWDLARRLARANAKSLPGEAEPAPAAAALARRAAVVGALVVLADASLIEPIAVRSGLWWWTEPGLFAVPPIGILGWAYFAGLAMALLSWPRLRSPAQKAAAVLVLAPLGTHLLLLATWWGALRWVNGDVAPWPVVAVAWALALALAAVAVRRRAGRTIPPWELLVRVPAAAFFFVLLAAHGAGDGALVAYALAFAPPYLALTWAATRTRGPLRAPSEWTGGCARPPRS
ncbi:MAG: carotenoid biosynthesis protein [Deltaproteobacteria bacterium]|nr:carotenoid biosynthesis protein [Deltaproteobacteria bacterium]